MEDVFATSEATARNIEAMRAGQSEQHKHQVNVKWQEMEERFVTRKLIPIRKKRRDPDADEDELYYENLMEKDRISFWGEKIVPVNLRHKYSYVRHEIGQPKRPVYLKLPNVERLKRQIQIRKIMQINYWMKTGTNPSRISLGKCDWYKGMEKFEEEYKATHPTMAEKFPKLRGLRKHLRVAREGQLELLSEEEEEVLEDKRLKMYPDAMAFSERSDFSDRLNSKEARRTPFETPFEAAHKKNEAREVTLAKFNEWYPNVGKRIKERRMSTVEDQMSRISEGELKKLIKDFAFSPEVCEVLINFRLAEFDQKKRSDTRTTLFKVGALTLRHAMFKHNWALASKACEILSQEVTRRRYSVSVSRWGMWNGGFLALVNIFKNDTEVLKNFMRLTRNIMRCYPPRLGVDVATWLIQKGKFNEGMRILEETQDGVPKFGPFPNTKKYVNPRMKGIMFVTQLLTAVKEYAKYKRNCLLFATNPAAMEEDGDSTDLYERGTFLLNLFEVLETRGDAIENDCTIFIEPLIDLKLTIEGKIPARETFQRICDKNPQNGVLADLYYQFLLQYFPDDSEEIDTQKAKMDQYDFQLSRSQLLLKRNQLEKYNKVVNKLPRVCSFKRLQKPSFSW